LGEQFTPSDYDRFSYHGYSFDQQGEFSARYSLSGPVGSIDFTETVRFPDVPGTTPSPRVARLLALACGLSYYKAAAPKTVHVEFGLTAAERVFLSELIKNGLGEFAFRNKLPESLTPEILAERLPDVDPTSPRPDDTVPLVPVGGGKDSVVTIESLKSAGLRPRLFSVNTYTPIQRCAAISGLDLLSVRRSIDSGLIEINNHGAYNGHVPVTAINSLIALLAADLLGIGPVIMSNERSAEYGNLEWNGLSINHQWSKSIEFERLLRSTLASDTDTYFSLLRPLSEIDIAHRFAKLPNYYSAFTSCNRAFALDASKRATAWCRECPKCQFVFLILAPFIPRAELEGIFGGNVLHDPNNSPGYREILGLDGHKPFECVGEYDEAALAIVMLADQHDWKDSIPVTTLLEELRRHHKVPSPSVRENLLRPAPDHLIPAHFHEALDALA
jgi:hypothetical protein